MPSSMCGKNMVERIPKYQLGITLEREKNRGRDILFESFSESILIWHLKLKSSSKSTIPFFTSLNFDIKRGVWNNKYYK